MTINSFQIDRQRIDHRGGACMHHQSPNIHADLPSPYPAGQPMDVFTAMDGLQHFSCVVVNLLQTTQPHGV